MEEAGVGMRDGVWNMEDEGSQIKSGGSRI